MARLRIVTILVLAALLMPSLMVQASSPPGTAGLWLSPSVGPGGDAPAPALSLAPPPCVTSTLGSQIVSVCIPPTFNGTLLVYAHGYAAPQLPLALPVELSLPEWQSLVGQMLSMGYGFATTSYSKNGYAIQQAEADLLALVDYVKALPLPAPVQKVLLLGVSEGGVITTMMVEKHPDVFAGGLAMCGPVGGMPYQVDYMGDFRVVFDYHFPGVFKPSFNAVDVPADAFLSWDSYSAAIAAAMAANPGKVEQLFRVRLVNATRVARDPANLAASSVQAAEELLWYNIWGTADIRVTAGGQPYNNLRRWYWGSSNDWKLNRGVEREAADTAARAYVKQYYQPTGKLQRPLVTLHATNDWVVPFRHETIYLARAIAAGRARNLTVLPVQRCGHCNFSETDVLGALGLLLLRTGGTVSPALQRDVQALPAPVR